MVQQVEAVSLRVDVRGSADNMVSATRRANRALRRHQEIATRITRQWQRGAGAAGSFSRGLARIGGFGGGLAVRRLQQAVIAAASFGAALQETAVSIGITVGQLQALDRVARAEGVQFNALSRSMFRFNRVLGEALQGVSEYQRILNNLGLDAETLVSAEVPQRLAIVSERIRLLDSQAEQSNALQQLFGRPGARLAPVLGAGADELRSRFEAAEQIASLTEEQTADLKRLAQAWQDFGDAISTSTRAVVAELATLLSTALETGAAVVTRIGDGVSRFFSALQEYRDILDGRLVQDQLVLGGDIVAARDQFETGGGIDPDEAQRQARLASERAARQRRERAQLQEQNNLNRIVRAEEKRLRDLQSQTEQINLQGADLLRHQFIQRAQEELLNRRITLQQRIAAEERKGNSQTLPDLRVRLQLVNEQIAGTGRLADSLSGVFQRQAQITQELRYEAEIRPAILEAVREEQAILPQFVQTLQRRVNQSRLELRFRGQITAEGERERFILESRAALQERVLEAQQQLAAAATIQNRAEREQSEAVAQARLAAIQEEQGGLNELADDYRGLFEEIERNNALAQQLERIQQVSGEVGNAIGRFASSAVQNFNGISEAARNTALAIADIILQQTVQRPIAGFISQGVSSLAGSFAGSLFGGGGGTSGLAARGNALGRFAEGGAFGVTNVYNISGSDEATVRRGIAQAAPSLSQSAVNRVGIEASRPSALRSSLAAG